MFPGRHPLVAGPPTRVELHAHMDGSVRHETIWELLREKKMEMPGDGSFRALRKALIVRDPVDLAHFLQPFNIYTPAIAGDLNAIERVAYEFCEDKANQNVLYVEARYTPHLWLDGSASRGRLDELGEVVKAVNRGFARAQETTGITVRSIMSMINGMGIENDILALCEQFRNDGVVGIDIAGPIDKESSDDYEEVPLTPSVVKVFEAAAKSGVHRTVHAGEAGGADMVKRAVENYLAERVGHGYHVVDDDAVYAMCRERGIHFECCPWSSLLTGAVKPGVAKHPIVRFAEDRTNFSLNTDDTTVTGVDLQDDYDLAGHWGLGEAHMVRTNLNALRHSFLPETEKPVLMKQLLANLGVEEP